MVGATNLTGDVHVVEFDEHIVVSGLGREVFYGTGAVLVVDAVDLRVRGPLESQSQAALTGAVEVDGEALRFVGEAALEAWAVGAHARRVAARGHVHLEGTARHRHPVVEHLHLVKTLTDEYKAKAMSTKTLVNLKPNEKWEIPHFKKPFN